MSISDEELAHLERLARIELDAEERESIRGDLSDVLDYFASISELDTDGIEELVRPVPSTNVLRPDEVRPSLAQQRALALMAESDKGFIKVPRTVDDD